MFVASFALSLAFAATPPAAAPDPETAQASARAEEVRIPLARFRLRTFRPVGNDLVYLQDWQRNWYKATLAEPCYNLGSALHVGFDTQGASWIDNSTVLLAEGESCRIISLVRSEGPPQRR